MMKIMIGFLCAATIICSCNSKPAENTTEAAKAFTSKNTDSFNIAFDSVLINYSSLRNAFIDWDTAAANKYAVLLQSSLFNVPYEQLKDEANATKANSLAQNAVSSLENLINIDSINDKRRIFYTVSESIYNLIKTTDYDMAVIYHKKCPMAFNDSEEGWWLSETRTIDNPYLGKYHPKYKNAMLECGIIEDSINNRQ